MNYNLASRPNPKRLNQGIKTNYQIINHDKKDIGMTNYTCQIITIIKLPLTCSCSTLHEVDHDNVES